MFQVFFPCSWKKLFYKSLDFFTDFTQDPVPSCPLRLTFRSMKGMSSPSPFAWDAPWGKREPFKRRPRLLTTKSRNWQMDYGLRGSKKHFQEKECLPKHYQIFKTLRAQIKPSGTSDISLCQFLCVLPQSSNIPLATKSDLLVSVTDFSKQLPSSQNGVQYARCPSSHSSHGFSTVLDENFNLCSIKL